MSRRHMVSTESFNTLIDQVSRLVECVRQQATMIHDLTVRLDKIDHPKFTHCPCGKVKPEGIPDETKWYCSYACYALRG